MAFFKNNQIKRPNCPKCGLDKGCLSPRMRYTGEGAKGILIIAEAPNKEEDEQGKLSVGEAGRLFRGEVVNAGMDLYKDCWRTNSVNCRPPEDKEPNKTSVDCCKPFVQGIIKETNPSKILLMGNAALESFYGGRTTHMSSIGKTHGMRFWDKQYQAWVYPLWSPEYLLEGKNKKNALLHAEWKRCVRRALTENDAPLQKVWNAIHPLTNYTSAVAALKDCLRNDTIIAVDFETTGLDMYKDGHSTLSFSWANSKGAWAVPVEHKEWPKQEQRDKIKELIGKILKKPKIAKIVQNITFEYQWTKAQFGVEPRNFFYDTQLATHVLDNRSGITGLKFQVFKRWGVGNYDRGIGSLIKTDETTGYNRMHLVPVDQLLEYNAYDALYTYELYSEQLNEFVGKELDAYNFLHEGAIALCEMSYNGISIDESYYSEQKESLLNERDLLIKEIIHSAEVAKYRRMFGDFNYDSPQDLQKMLFNVLNIKPVKETSASTALKRTYSVDEEVLSKIDIPLTQNILKIRKLNKMVSTYVDGFLSKSQNGMLHPYFSLTRARSFRSSSSNPNFQNIPKRDLKAKKITRRGMVPRKGRVFGEMDFSGAEIVTSIYYHKDPTFTKYQTDGNADMHKDGAAEILRCTPDDIPKPIRQATKGIWTFSQFYGSYYVNCARQGWEEYPQCTDGAGELCTIRKIPIDKYMMQTFKGYKDFEAHLKKFENKFWNQWFPVYTRWKKKVVDEYKKTGYVETLLGFRFKGYMDRKQCTNYPIQGTSFHLLLYTAVQFSKELKRRGLETLMIGQIHDSLILDIPVEEINEVRDILTDIVRNMDKVYDWMTVPMDLELEISDPREDGGSFASMHELELAA